MIINTLSFERKILFKDNLTKLSKFIDQSISENDTSFYFLGELIFDEYKMDVEYIKSQAISEDSDKMDAIKKIASDHMCYLSIGYVESVKDKLYNSQVVIDPLGNIIHNHRKFNLTSNESKVFSKGQSPVTSFSIGETIYSLSICYDMFSPSFKKDYDERTHILLHSLTDPQDGKFTLGFTSRFTNSYYFAANRFSSNVNAYYNGHIGIFSPRGKKLSFSMDKENIKTFQLKNDFNIPKFGVLKYIRIFFHLITHLRPTIAYLKWNKKNKN
jgi:predicted amidohydrolase